MVFVSEFSAWWSFAPFSSHGGSLPFGGFLFPGRDPGPSAAFERILGEWRAADCPRPSTASLAGGSLSIPEGQCQLAWTSQGPHGRAVGLSGTLVISPADRGSPAADPPSYTLQRWDWAGLQLADAPCPGVPGRLLPHPPQAAGASLFCAGPRAPPLLPVCLLCPL